MALDLRSSELEHSFIKERINSAEKHILDINSKISAYVKKIAHVRDSGDDLAKCILHFASAENLNHTLRTALGQFSDILSSIQEYRDTEIQRTEMKVIFELSNYSSICKQAKKDLKESFEARAKELSKKNHLEKTRGKNPSNWQKIAEKEVNQARDEATRTTHELGKRIDHFEKQKLEDLKRLFLEFIKIELIFHAKALELYTQAYNSVKSIDVEADLNEFRCHFRAHSSNLESDVLQLPTAVKPTKMNDTNNATPTMSFQPAPLKNSQVLQRSVFTTKNIQPRLDNSVSSVDSIVSSKFGFGDHTF